jgi:hypothetical protein
MGSLQSYFTQLWTTLYLKRVPGDEIGVLGRIVICNPKVPGKESWDRLQHLSAAGDFRSRRSWQVDWFGGAIHGASSFIRNTEGALPQSYSVLKSMRQSSARAPLQSIVVIHQAP